MATKRNLTGVGLPGAVANLLGTDPARSFTAAGTAQANATPLTSNFAVVTGAAGAGVKLPSAAGSPVQVIRVVPGAGASLYPHEGDSINGQATNAPLALSPGGRLILIPSDAAWLAIVSA